MTNVVVVCQRVAEQVMAKLMLEIFKVIWRFALVTRMAPSQMRSERRWLVTVTDGRRVSAQIRQKCLLPCDHVEPSSSMDPKRLDTLDNSEQIAFQTKEQNYMPAQYQQKMRQIIYKPKNSSLISIAQLLRAASTASS